MIVINTTFSQQKKLSPQEAMQIFNSGEYESYESIEYDLDTVGTQIIRQLFYDKVNYPDRISKEKYLERYTSSRKEYLGRDGFSKWQAEAISRLYKKRRNDKDYRKRIYTLTDEDSLLVYGSKKSFNNRKTKIKGEQPLWTLSLFDTTMIENPYYSFFKFTIKSVGSRSYDVWPRTVANSVTENEEYTGKSNVFIYDSKFLVGIPKVNLKNKDNEKLELPLLLLGVDFISYPINNQLLINILKVSGYSDSASFSSLVLLYARFNYVSSRKQELYEIPCKKFNLFKRERCYKFSVLEGSWSLEDNQHNYRRTYYIATINKSYDIKYNLVEEPENLTMYIQESLNTYYSISSHKPEYYKEPRFVVKRGRRFIYKTDWIETKSWQYDKDGKEQFEYKKFKVKITYKRGEVFFKEIELKELN